MKTLKTRIQSDMIPHEKFHRGKWMKSKGSDWYHFVPCKVSHNFIEDSTFYSTLDTELVELVKYLHANKKITTPSCAGHFLSEEECRERFDQLKKEESKIKKRVLVLEDSETNLEYLYRDTSYVLPYSEEDFIERLQDYGRKGVLGIKDFPEEALSKLDIPCLTIKKDKDVTLFLTEPKTKEELIGTWNTLYEVIVEAIPSKKEALSEIGDASQTPYKWTKSESTRFPGTVNYTFTTDKGTEYQAYFVLSTKGFYEFGFNVGDGDPSQTINKGELFKVMSTIVDIMKDGMKTLPWDRIEFEGSKDFDRVEKGIEDKRRDKLYRAYLKKHLPPKVDVFVQGGVTYLYNEDPNKLTEKKDIHKAMNPGILSSKSQLKGEDGKIKITYVRKELSKQKDKNSTYSKALKRFINYHDDK